MVVLVGAGTLACRSRPAGDAGSVAASALASAAPSSTGPGVPVADGGLPTAPAEVPPARLRIPAIGVDARVGPVAVDPATNDFAVPPSVDEVGWYRYGPGLTATAGSVVIAGHVDGAKQGAGAFFKLRELDTGDRIEVLDPAGATVRFTVVAREIYRKSAIPLDRYFARDGGLRLTLITCGGPFDRETGHYRDNVVITAAPTT
ncbi:class F sortase [Virgisporangium aurantiacum]|uniref:Class F sortase n=1 Tax=Virgisporangium aurantiacum TaxID=175570 RepID=A0A8J3YWZ5_9ACTN|nr:class F sortase [Virgisporangium aurantiacum]